MAKTLTVVHVFETSQDWENRLAEEQRQVYTPQICAQKHGKAH